jgi:hypothetical protein
VARKLKYEKEKAKFKSKDVLVGRLAKVNGMVEEL